MPDAPQNAHELVKCRDMRFKSILLARPFPLDELVGLAEGSVFASSMRSNIALVYDELVGLKQSLFLFVPMGNTRVHATDKVQYVRTLSCPLMKA